MGGAGDPREQGGKRGRERGPWSDKIIGYPAGGGETPRGERTRREERKFVGRHTMSRRFESRGAVREVHPDEIIGYESQIPMGSSLGRRVRRDSNRASLCSVRRSFFRFSARAGFFFYGIADYFVRPRTRFRVPPQVRFSLRAASPAPLSCLSFLCFAPLRRTAFRGALSRSFCRGLLRFLALSLTLLFLSASPLPL